jgi:hypothetical protein
MDPMPTTGGTDEARLREYARRLADAIDEVLPSWVVRSVERFTSDAARLEDARVAGEEARADVGASTRALLELDIDAQTETPLGLLRQAVRYPTAILRAAGVPPVSRDAFAARAFPEDIYGLGPATFADVDPSLHEPGIEWGAAKAHVHLTRRRAEGRR